MLSAVWIVCVGWLGRYTACVMILIPAAFVAVVLSQPDLWTDARHGYPNDSFWTLTAAGRLGVIAIASSGLIATFLFIAAKTNLVKQLPISRFIIVPCDLIFGAVVYILVDTVSPQVFYAFYQTIFPDLPRQIVVTGLPDWEDFRRLISFDEDPSMAGHLRAVGFWAICPFTLWLHYQRVGGRT